MRIAVCYSGFLRNYEHTYPRAFNFLFNVLKPDIFFYGYPNNEGLDVSQEKFEQLYKPTRYKIIEYTDTLRDGLRKQFRYERFSYRHGSTSVDGLLSQYRNLYLANELRKDYEAEHNIKYDVVIKARLDMFWVRPIMEGELQAAADGFLIAPGTWDFKTVNAYAMTDVFAISNSDNMNTYCDIYNHLGEHYENGSCFHHESITGWHAMKTGLDKVRISCEPHMFFEYPEEFNGIPYSERDRRKY